MISFYYHNYRLYVIYTRHYECNLIGKIITFQVRFAGSSPVTRIKVKKKNIRMVRFELTTSTTQK